MTVIDTAFHVVHDYPGGSTSLAPRMGKNPATLCHEVKGRDGYKLGLADAVKVTLLTDDMRILHAFAAECGHMALRLPDTAELPDACALGRISALAREFNDLVQAFTAGVTDGRVSANELAGIRRRWGEMLLAGSALVDHASALHNTHKKGDGHGR